MNLTPEQLKRILAKDRRRSDEVLFGTYVGPQGDQGRHFITLEDGTQVLQVGSAMPGVTFRPGIQLPIISPRAGTQRTIVGFPPPGRKGAAFPKATRRTTQPAPTVEAGYEFISMTDGFGATYTAYRHNDDGSLNVSLGSVTGDGPVDSGSRIALDSEELVGENAILIVANLDTFLGIRVYDVAGATLYTYDPPAGWLPGRGAGYFGGWVYWVEIDGGTTDVRLRRARADLTSVSTVTTGTIDAHPDIEADWPEARSFTISETAVLAGWDVLYDESFVYTSIRFPLDGSTPSTSTSAYQEQMFEVPVSSTDGIGYQSSVIPGDRLLQRADTASSAPAEPWPDDPAWQKTGSTTIYNVDLSADGVDALLYFRDSSSATAIVGPLTGASGDPSQSVTIDNGTATESDLCFFYEVTS